MYGVQPEVFVADPHVAQQPLDMFAGKHVSEQHLVPRQCFPAQSIHIYHYNIKTEKYLYTFQLSYICLFAWRNICFFYYLNMLNKCF